MIRQQIETETAKMVTSLDMSSGYYLDLYTNDSKDKERNGKIELDSWDDEMFFEVENQGKARKLSIQMYVDYKQAPIIIEENKYDIFVIDASEEYSNVFSFRLEESLDTNMNHSLLTILTAGSDIYTSQTEFELTDSYSIALNHILSFGKDNTLVNSLYDYEEAEIATEYNSTGLLLNTDITKRSRKLPERELAVKANDSFDLQYQVGGYEDCSNIAIIITVGFNQAKINNQDYLLCETKNGELLTGIANLKAPENPGLYEIMGWAITNPFNDDKSHYLPLESSFRFTLKVE